ncbi:FxsA family protein [Acuticoccus sp. MNP-M23]|uniref:FxsA family protein n=1 Tax=Acuticoccus sp. MNP-M23 TaxID=3072793 RepID=UPI002814F75C|nr:FxsA family protein [Acuticoccus sp. MNP-M23]WMS44325.1 FxsA family protein [Acuticoccus sp. MNP-M23]
MCPISLSGLAKRTVVIRLFLIAILIAIPIAEVAVFLLVGSIIGALPTIALIILTAVLGATLLKRQGLSAIARLKADMDQNKVPAGAIGQAVTVAIAGILLLTPGFITDTVGLLLFVPAVRSSIWRQVSGAVKMERGKAPQRSTGAPRQRTHARTIDLDQGDYRPKGGDDDSPWSGPSSGPGR